MIYINRLFFNLLNSIRKVYLRSNLYDKKISKINENNLIYRPSPHLLSSLIKYQKQKFKIEDFAVLCSNCHRMAHKRKEPYTIEELKEFIKNN